jgi:hypothetical protein
VLLILDRDAFRRNFNSQDRLEKPSLELKLRLKASLPEGGVQKGTKSSTELLLHKKIDLLFLKPLGMSIQIPF